MQHVPRGRPTGKLHAAETDGQNGPPLDGRNNDAKTVERMGDLVAAKAQRHDHRLGIFDRRQLGGQGGAGRLHQPAGGGGGDRQNDRIARPRDGSLAGRGPIDLPVAIGQPGERIGTGTQPQ